MLDKIYHVLLWLLGFREGEHITDMLRRQKDRFGKWWWCIPALSGLAYLSAGAFLSWLFLHILGINF